MSHPSRSGPIVHVVQHLRPGGLEVVALELARAQARHHPAFVVSLDGDAASALAAWPRLGEQRDQLIFMGKGPGVDAALWPRLHRLFRRLQPGGVHTHHIGPLFYAGPAARGAGVAQRVHTEHDAWHLQDAKRRRLVRLALAATRPVLIADAPHVAEAVAAALACPPPRVILNGVDTERFTPGDKAAARRALGLPEIGPIIGIAARLEPVKGVDIAISALQSLPNVMMAIAGSGGEAARLEALTTQLGVAPRVRFLGHLDDTLLLYRAADVVCLPSRAEGLPLAILEAQSSGTRVVASDVGGVAAAIDPASGILVPPENPGALAQGLRTALDDAASGPSSSRAFVQRTASLDVMAAAYSALMLGGVR